jgi:spore maturation protein CgeB
VRVVIFCHSLISDWNHGNAHFLRGIAAELRARGHQVRVFEPRNSWSIANLQRDHGQDPIECFTRAFPGFEITRYDHTLDLDEALDGAGLVLVHEWNERDLVRRIGLHRACGASYRLLFHDTHHRSVTNPEAMAAYDLSGYDGVLAFGETIRQVYLRNGWARRVWTWHEAADTRIFNRTEGECEGDLVWIGNWGDGERTAELDEFLLLPVRELGLRARVHGVRYPEEARAALESAGIEYRGWLPNYEVPAVFGRFRATVHIPRRPYVEALRGIPTIRMFEALACGIPLVSAPWDDCEGLFQAARDYLVACNGAAMRRHLRALLADEGMSRQLALHGRQTILARHTCAHRVDELMHIVRELG